MPPNGERWTVETLREHLTQVVDIRFRSLEISVDQRFQAHEKAVNSAMRAAGEAVGKAEEASTERFDSLNEFERRYQDSQRSLMPRAECEIRLNGIDSRLNELFRERSENKGKDEGFTKGWGRITAVIALAIAIASFFRG